MLDQDRSFVDPEEDMEDASTGFATEDDAPNDDEPPPKDEQP